MKKLTEDRQFERYMRFFFFAEKLFKGFLVLLSIKIELSNKKGFRRVFQLEMEIL